jgi:SAM-dependent methyltransferase
MSKEMIKSIEDVLDMLDSLLRTPEPFWNEFYSDRDRKVPFFVNSPDENLVTYVKNNQISRGKVLDIGCGAGRNSIYLAKQGYEVIGIDLSQEAIDWAEERAREEGLNITFLCKSVFDLAYESEFDFLYDSGCLHHIYPHRRIQYINFLYKVLRPGGKFGLTCFAPGCDEGTSGHISDWEVYRGLSMKGGLSFSEEKLKDLFNSHFKLIEFRGMKEIDKDENTFGVPFISVSLWEKI